MGSDAVELGTQSAVAVPGTAGVVTQAAGVKTHILFKIEIDLLYRRRAFCHNLVPRMKSFIIRKDNRKLENRLEGRTFGKPFFVLYLSFIFVNCFFVLLGTPGHVLCTIFFHGLRQNLHCARFSSIICDKTFAMHDPNHAPWHFCRKS